MAEVINSAHMINMLQSSAKSISSRIYSMVLFGNALIILVMLIYVVWSRNQLEIAAINSDRLAEINQFEEIADKSKSFETMSSKLIRIYRPFQQSNQIFSTDLPSIFDDLSVPYFGEIDYEGTEYIVIIQEFEDGILYVAKDIALFDEYESIFITSEIIFFIILILLSWILAVSISRKISLPIINFSELLEKTNIETNHLTINKKFHDLELNIIADSFNKLLKRTEDMLNREKTFISMASHELRTPIAVILGAANIIESRNQLSEKDQITLERIISAAKNMQSNINALLLIARKQTSNQSNDLIYISQVVHELLKNYALENSSSASRVIIKLDNPKLCVKCEEAIIRILLHNIISNALNHTQGKVFIKIQENSITIEDEGIINHSFIENSNELTEKVNGGLGMYIINLICEKLGWHFEIQANQSYGTRVRIWPTVDGEAIA